MNRKERPAMIQEIHKLDWRNDSKEKARCNKKEKQFKHGSKFCKSSAVMKFSWSVQICT